MLWLTETFKNGYMPLEVSENWHSAGFSLSLGGKLVQCNTRCGPTVAAVNGCVDIPVASVQPRELRPTRAAHCRAGQCRSQRLDHGSESLIAIILLHIWGK